MNKVPKVRVKPDHKGAKARGDQTEASSAAEHCKQLASDPEAQRGSEPDDENLLTRHLRPDLGAILQRIWFRRFGRLAADALRSAVPYGPTSLSHGLEHAFLEGREFWCRLIQRSFRT